MNSRIFFVIPILFAFILSSCSYEPNQEIASPNNKVKVQTNINEEGQFYYKVLFNNKVVIDSSTVGFEFMNMPAIGKGLKVSRAKHESDTETWEMIWGEQRKIINDYSQLKLDLQEKENLKRKFSIIFRVYDDGIGFCYDFPKQRNIDSVTITDELTQFRLTGDHKAWWTPGDWDIYEHLYNTTRVSEIDAISKRSNDNLAQTYIPYNAVNTPVTMKTDNGIYLSFHEANLNNYAGMTLLVDTKNLVLTSGLVGNDFGWKVKRETPFVTPWRTIQIAERAGDLIESKLILNLNDHNVLQDVSYIKPMKYVGIWWEMHLGKSSWDMASGKHGATTENAKRYIDFAAKNGIGGVLVEGWNTGWEHWIGFEDREGVFDFVTPYPDYDLKEVVSYAKEKSVELIMHNETSAAIKTYEQQMDTAFTLYEKLGVHYIKTGYVGQILPDGYYHHGQFMVNHYRKVIEKAAEHKIAIDAHEPIKDTGERRTFPNMLTREGLRGNEFNAWSSDGGNPPEHLTIVPFTRMLAGPIDFTPGIFDIKFNKYKKNNQVNTTIAQQLALYVVLYSPLQMAADLPENYEGHPAFQFIRDVGVNWDETKVLDGEIGEFVTIARKERDTGNWFVGSVTDENEREVTISLSFLDVDKTYRAVIYKDGKDADYKKNPTSYEIENKEVTSNDELKIHLAPGGGFALSLFSK